MRMNVLFCLCFVALLIFTGLVFANEDKNNMGWRFSWMSPVYDELDVNYQYLDELPDIKRPFRGHCAGAWYDFDGDGNKEYFHDDNNWQKTYVFENDGDNTYV